jgi:hypothetical protein
VREFADREERTIGELVLKGVAGQSAVVGLDVELVIL